MSAVPARNTKNKRVRFSSMEDDNVKQEEKDTLYEKKRDTRGTPKTALKATKGGGYEQLVEVVNGGRGGQGACGRWMVTLTLCASFLGLVSGNCGCPWFSYNIDSRQSVREDSLTMSLGFIHLKHERRVFEVMKADVY